MDLLDKYSLKLDKVFNRTFKKFGDRFVCPCCNYPTLAGRISYEICGLCDWEDDGQDDGDADQVAGGPNSDYSLTEARENFKRHLTMYRPSDTIAFKRLDKEKIKEIKKIYDDMFTLVDNLEIDSKLRQAGRLENNLRK
jgi:hypothetical protein